MKKLYLPVLLLTALTVTVQEAQAMNYLEIVKKSILDNKTAATAVAAVAIASYAALKLYNAYQTPVVTQIATGSQNALVAESQSPAAVVDKEAAKKAALVAQLKANQEADRSDVTATVERERATRRAAQERTRAEEQAAREATAQAGLRKTADKKTV